MTPKAVAALGVAALLLPPASGKTGETYAST
jgi:hypothetical protein